jgi:TPR repeat protein
MKQGRRVRVEGLTANPELNGRCGVICGACIEDSGRWAVLIDADSTRPSCKCLFRPSNLKMTQISVQLCAAVARLASSRALVDAQCDLRCIASIHHALIPVPCPFCCTPLCDAALLHRQRQHLLCSGGTAKLAVSLSLYSCMPASAASSRHMHCIVRRVAAGLAVAAPEGLHFKARNLRFLRRFSCAAAQYEKAIALQHGPSHADLAWLLLRGRQALAKDEARAFELAASGARKGCSSCAGVLAFCYLQGHGCARDETRAMQLALASAAAGCSYGQCAAGFLHRHGWGGAVRDYAAALVLYRLAAVQGLDEAQFWLGDMHFHGKGLDDDFEEALRWCVGLFLRVYFVTFCACTSLQPSRVIQKRAAGCRCATQGAGAS